MRPSDSPYFSRATGKPSARRVPVALLAAGLVAAAATVSAINFWPERQPAPVALPAPEPKKPFPEVTLEAASAIVVDLRTGETLYAKDADTARPLASITKLVTALVARDALSPDAAVSLPRQERAPTVEELPAAVPVDASGTPYFDYEAPPPAPVWRTVSANLRAEDLIAFTLVASSNDGADALARASTKTGDAPFPDRMNEYARKVGMRDARFGNPSGLDEGGQASAVASARDVATLLGYIARHATDMIAPTAKPKIVVPSSSGPLTAINTDAAVGRLPNLVGGKTGFTDVAGGNLAVIVDPGLNSPIAIVALGSSKSGRFTDVLALASSTMAYLAE